MERFLPSSATHLSGAACKIKACAHEKSLDRSREIPRSHPEMKVARLKRWMDDLSDEVKVVVINY